ncbi:MAG: acyl-CoA dehydrogenase family protein [Rhizobiaceae bacterium]|nr:acyl-CoA dehydrogenase family protein [Rhizobiaceae bacterium]
MFPVFPEDPFVEERHRQLQRDIDDWARPAVERVQAEFEGDMARSRAFAGALGEAGWLQRMVGQDGASGSPRFDVRSLCTIRETLAYHWSLADFAFVLQGIGSACIVLEGSQQQRARYMPGVLAGTLLPAFALTEAAAGSDAASIQTRAERRGDTFVLNGDKTWISNGGIADFYIVFARTGDATEWNGISAFIVDRETPGFHVGEQIEIVAPHVIAPLELRDCAVPAGQLLGREGEGFKLAMGVLDIFRTTVGAAALGFARRALDEALGHVERRHLFGQRLFDLQATKLRLAEMAADVEAARLMVYRAAWVRDVLGRRVTYEASMAKAVATENAQRVIDGAVQLLGGLGVKKGSVVESLYRDIRPLRIYEGATEVQKLVIADQLMKRWSQFVEGQAQPA